MPFPDALHTKPDLAGRLNKHAEELMANLRATADTRQMKFQHDRLEIECIIPKRSKRFIDNIDFDLVLGLASETVIPHVADGSPLATLLNERNLA